MSDVLPSEKLDCRGMLCPLPVLRTKKALQTMASGDILKVISTDAGSIADMAAFSRLTGNEIVEQSEGGGEYIFFFKKG